jgi:peptidoglycan-N-acetylmuramic acid deacetylase
MKNKFLICLIVFLIAVLLLLIVMATRLNTDAPSNITTASPSTGNVTTTGPSISTPPETTVQPTTTPPETTVPPTTTLPETTVPPTTVPSVQIPPAWEGIDLYTRAELEALPNKKNPFGPGRTSNGVRPPYPVADQEKYGQYAGNFIGPDNGKIYLTFDCGYEYTATDPDGTTYRVTERILDVLKEKGVKGVFFITIHYAETQSDLIRRMIDEGHIVGNHTCNHPAMPDVSIDKMIYEVMTLHDYVRDRYSYEMFLFRPPTGAFSVQSLAVVQNLGYKNVHWSFAYSDWDTENQPDHASSLKLMTDSAHSGAIYLLHAISTTNANILGDAIDAFRAQGYEIDLFQ